MVVEETRGGQGQTHHLPCLIPRPFCRSLTSPIPCLTAGHADEGYGEHLVSLITLFVKWQSGLTCCTVAALDSVEAGDVW